MNTFNVLVVDDDKGILDAAKEELEAIDGVRVTTLDSVDAALKTLHKMYFHLAIVDLEYNNRPDGTRIFKFLRDERPSCEAMLLTQHLGDLKEDVFRLFNPKRPQAVALLNKLDVAAPMKDAVEERAKAWLRNPLLIENREELLQILLNRQQWPSGRGISPSLDEVDYLLSKLLGQGKYRQSSRHDIASAKFETMMGGRSLSIVLKCRPTTAAGKQGIWSVVKVGPRAEAAEEYERYCRFVRYLLSLDVRVELLAFESADSLGAMAYSFAGRSPNAVATIGDLFLRSDVRTFEILERLFALDSQFWYSVEGPGMSAGTYLREFHSLNSDRLIALCNKTLQEVINSERANCKVIQLGDSNLAVEFGKERIGVPTKTMGSGAFRKSLPTCIVHGDMNPGNLIVAEDNRVIMIDYRHTEFAPRCLDFAALETNLRLTPYVAEHTFLGAVRDLELDQVVWAAGWNESRLPDGAPFWCRVSVKLIEHARANFINVTQAEYAVTCFVWAMRVAKLDLASHFNRFRLLCWVSFLEKIILNQEARSASSQ